MGPWKMLQKTNEWILYNDNDQVKYENRSLLERFSKPTMNYTQGKSFVRGGYNNLLIPTF